MGNPETVVSGDRTPPSDAERELQSLLNTLDFAIWCRVDAGYEYGMNSAEREAHDNNAKRTRAIIGERFAALLADRARVDVLSEYLDDISFHFEPGKPEPVVVLAFFVGDGGGHTTVSGDTLREATDVYLAMLARADAGEDSDEDAARAPGASGNTKNA